MLKPILIVLVMASILMTSCQTQVQLNDQKSPGKFVIIGYVPGFQGELDEKLESDIVEAAARSHLPSAINALPQHLRILAQQRRNELQREQLHRFRGS